MFSFQTLLKGTFSLLTCHLQFSITARVIDTKTSISAKSFRPQSSPYFLSKPRTRNSRTNGLKQNKWSFPLVWSREGGKSEWDWGEKRKIRLKNTIETDKEKKRKDNKKEKKTVMPSKLSSWKVNTGTINPFPLIHNKAPKVLDAQVEYIP